MNKLLLSKFYIPNILLYFSLFGNIVYLFALLIVRSQTSNFCIDDFSCDLMQYTSFSFKYYLKFCILLFVLILGTLIELFLRKIKVIKLILSVHSFFLKKIVYILSIILIPTSFAYLIFLFCIIFAIFDTINSM